MFSHFLIESQYMYSDRNSENCNCDHYNNDSNNDNNCIDNNCTLGTNISFFFHYFHGYNAGNALGDSGGRRIQMVSIQSVLA